MLSQGLVQSGTALFSDPHLIRLLFSETFPESAKHQKTSDFEAFKKSLIFDARIRAKFDPHVTVLEGHEGSVSAIAISDGRIYSASMDHTLRVWDASNGAQLQILKGHKEWVRSIAVQDGRVYSGSYDKTIRVLDFLKPKTS